MLSPLPSSLHHPSRAQSQSNWRPPPVGKLKYNMDATFDKDKRTGAVITIIRDHQGRLITGKALKVHTSSSLVAEVLAIQEGIILAQSYYCDSNLLESNCLVVVEACRNKISIPEASIII